MRDQDARAILEARLLVNRICTPAGCWLWTRSCQPKGYGQTSWPGGRRNVRVHRVAAVLWLGFDIDSPQLVLHRCDTPRCFNPDHLFVGTAADNTSDMMAKGRNNHGNVCGEDHPRHKLTADMVREIRQRVAS